METETDIFLGSLVKWMSTFPVSAGRNPAESLCDGVAMAQVKRIKNYFGWLVVVIYILVVF